MPPLAIGMHVALWGKAEEVGEMVVVLEVSGRRFLKCGRALGSAGGLSCGALSSPRLMDDGPAGFLSVWPDLSLEGRTGAENGKGGGRGRWVMKRVEWEW